ncbi:nitroreductase/quinone reductase family protein [Nostocoides vanveenii]|uniref:nitroreductase/quinone reductase family protein n=1 Tax=Nostocoides vanveenii TaxID=330835 RepID=UPI0031E2E7EC
MGRNGPCRCASSPIAPDSWLVVASLADSPQNPAWLHNLRAHPDQVRLRVGAATFTVTPTTLPRAERDEVWERIVTEAPDFANYQRSTDRVIPVVRLTRGA